MAPGPLVFKDFVFDCVCYTGIKNNKDPTKKITTTKKASFDNQINVHCNVHCNMKLGNGATISYLLAGNRWIIN